MKKLRAAFCATLCGASLFAGAAVEGVVELPSQPKGSASGERYQIKASAIGKPDPIQAVIYLEGDFPKTAPLRTVEVAQEGFQFARAVTPVQKGTKVEFPNRDDDFHNVFSYSKVKRFDVGRYRKDEKPTPSQVFDKPGVVKLFCEIHEHMRGTIVVLDTPHFVKSDENGKYRLEGLPPGKYTLKAWVEDKVIERPVELKEGETVKVDFK